MKKAKETLIKVTAYLNQCKAAARGILDDPVVLQWDNVRIDKHTSVLTDLEIFPDDLYFASDNYHKTANQLLEETARWENARGNLEADIRLNGIDPDKALSEAAKLLVDCQQMQELLTKIADYHEILIGTAELIQQNLSITTIIPLALIGQARKKKKAFNNGYDVFSMVTKDPILKSSTLNIHDLSDQATSIATKFSQLELPDMPLLTKAIIEAHMETCLTALEDANSFLVFCGQTCKQDLQNIKTFTDSIEDLKKQSFSIILSSLQEKSQTLRGYIATFEHKSRTMKEVRRMTFLLSNLQSTYSAMRHSYLPYITAQTTDKNSPLHPDIFAAEISKNYFKGVRGFIRLIRLFFSTTKESGVLSEIDLTDKISIALSTCPYYHAQGKNDLAKMVQFTDNLISYYKKPFPFDDLSVILKKSIETYGVMIKKDFYKFKPDGLKIHDDEEQGKDTENNKPLRIGRMLGKIEIQAHRFNALQPK